MTYTNLQKNISETLSNDRFAFAKTGTVEQPVLQKFGDDVRIDWGYFYLTTEGKASYTIGEGEALTYVNAEIELNKSSTLLTFAYDDIESIEYFGKRLHSYWNKDGQPITEAIAEAINEYDELKIRCKDFSDKLCNDAVKAGGEKYAELGWAMKDGKDGYKLTKA